MSKPTISYQMKPNLIETTAKLMGYKVVNVTDKFWVGNVILRPDMTIVCTSRERLSLNHPLVKRDLYETYGISTNRRIKDGEGTPQQTEEEGSNGD